MKLLTTTAALALLAGSAAIAQTTAPSTTAPAPSTTAPSTAAPASGTMAPSTSSGTMSGTSGSTMSGTAGSTMSGTSGGMQMSTGGMATATANTVAVRFITVTPTDAVASRIRGADVMNRNNEKLGDIEDFVITDGKTISGVIISVGGFLGLGERYVAVEPSALTLVRDGTGFKAMMNTTKDELNNAPKFEYNRVNR